MERMGYHLCHRPFPRSVLTYHLNTNVTFQLIGTSRNYNFPAVFISMSQPWDFPAVSIGTHDCVIHSLPPFPLIPMFILCLAQILLFTLWIDPFQSFSSSHIHGDKHTLYACACVLSFTSGNS